MVMPMNFYGMGMGSGMGMNSGMANSSGNVYADLKAKYGCGYEDFYERPRISEFPVDTIPQPDERHKYRTWLGRMIRKIYS